MTLGCVSKKEDDQLDYDIDFSRWLSEGDTVQSAHVITDAGVTVESVLIEATVVKIWLSGGKARRSYRVSVIATTAQGRKKEVCFSLRVRAC